MKKQDPIVVAQAHPTRFVEKPFEHCQPEPAFMCAGAALRQIGIESLIQRHDRTWHTVCDMVITSSGKTAAVTFLFAAFVGDVIVTSMQLL